MYSIHHNEIDMCWGTRLLHLVNIATPLLRRSQYFQLLDSRSFTYIDLNNTQIRLVCAQHVMNQENMGVCHLTGERTQSVDYITDLHYLYLLLCLLYFVVTTRVTFNTELPSAA